MACDASMVVVANLQLLNGEVDMGLAHGDMVEGRAFCDRD